MNLIAVRIRHKNSRSQIDEKRPSVVHTHARQPASIELGVVVLVDERSKLVKVRGLDLDICVEPGLEI